MLAARQFLVDLRLMVVLAQSIKTLLVIATPAVVVRVRLAPTAPLSRLVEHRLVMRAAVRSAQPAVVASPETPRHHLLESTKCVF